MKDNLATDVQDFLVTQGFQPEAVDSRTNKPPVGADGRPDPSQADLFSFDWESNGRNYGTVVILLNNNGDFEVYYGDNLGKGMEPEDKNDWYRFLEQLKHFAIKNARMGFKVQDLGRLRYAMQGMAAIKEGLFEGYYGRRNVSYRDEPKKVRLMIRHNRDLEEGEARYRAIESIFVETGDGERFRVPSRSLAHGRLLARHASEGGSPYDAFGQHINEMMSEIRALGSFLRASRHRTMGDEAQALTEVAGKYYEDLKRQARGMMTQRGYHAARESFDPSQVRDSSVAVEAIREMFTEPKLDRRIEEALPLLSRLAEMDMKEANEFESWASDVMEGTWEIPRTPEQKKKLVQLMAEPLEVGADATNAKDALADIVGDDELFDRLEDLAERDPRANIWDDKEVMLRLSMLAPFIKDQVPSQEPTMESDISGLLAAAHLNRAFIITAKTAEGPTKKYRVRAQSERVAREKFARHYAMAKVLDVKEEEPATENLDTDGVMMTKQSNMSSESVERSNLTRILELARR